MVTTRVKTPATTSINDTPYVHTYTRTLPRRPQVCVFICSSLHLLPAPPMPGTIVSAVLHRAVFGDKGRRTLALTKPITYTVHYTLVVSVTRHLGDRWGKGVGAWLGSGERGPGSGDRNEE